MSISDVLHEVGAGLQVICGMFLTLTSLVPLSKHAHSTSTHIVQTVVLHRTLVPLSPTSNHMTIVVLPATLVHRTTTSINSSIVVCPPSFDQCFMAFHARPFGFSSIFPLSCFFSCPPARPHSCPALMVPVFNFDPPKMLEGSL